MQCVNLLPTVLLRSHVTTAGSGGIDQDRKLECIMCKLMDLYFYDICSFAILKIMSLCTAVQFFLF